MLQTAITTRSKEKKKRNEKIAERMQRDVRIWMEHTRIDNAQRWHLVAPVNGPTSPRVEKASRSTETTEMRLEQQPTSQPANQPTNQPNTIKSHTS